MSKEEIIKLMKEKVPTYYPMGLDYGVSQIDEISKTLTTTTTS